MDFPAPLWPDAQERLVAQSLAEGFAHEPVFLTDRLTNSLWLSPAAEELLGDRAEALVNRLAASLLGFDFRARPPAGFQEALLGEGPAWRGAIRLAESPRAGWYLVEASSARLREALVCGMVRIRKPLEIQQ